MPNAYGFDPHKAQADEIEHSRRYADAMRQQSGTPIQPYSSGGISAPISWTQGLAKVLEGASAGGWRRKAEEDAKALQGQREQRRGADMSLMAQALRGRQATPGGLTEDASGNVTQADPMQAQTPMQSFGQALPMMQDPGAIQMGFNLMGMQQKEREGEENRAARLEERAMMLEAQAQNAAASAAERAQARAEAANLRRELQASQQSFQRQIAADNLAVRRDALAQGNKPPPGFRYTPDGNMERIPGGPADLKDVADREKKAAGAGDVDIALGTLRDAYDRLEKGGGITSTENSPLGNVMPSVASSGVGQAAGKLFGTQNQSARNDIAMARPALLAALMRATGMSAKQMDSNAELKLWLSTATDPTLDVESNRRALNNIEKKYLGSGTPSAAQAPQQPRIVDW